MSKHHGAKGPADRASGKAKPEPRRYRDIIQLTPVQKKIKREHHYQATDYDGTQIEEAP